MSRNSTKKRVEQHLIDEEGQGLLRSALPREWVLREYRPDYGLDFALELFKTPSLDRGASLILETLGEHIFIQLKSCKRAPQRALKLYGRYNVEREEERISKGDFVGELSITSFSLDTKELATIERMGAAVPVLLVLADLGSKRCYFVCLNDYIEKILVPRHQDYWSTSRRVIHIPTLNRVDDPVVGHTALRWYGKRPKLYAAFQKFVFQETELRREDGAGEFSALAYYFAKLLLRYDFWDDTEMWQLLGSYGQKLRRFAAVDSVELRPVLRPLDEEFASSALSGFYEDFGPSGILELWRLLAVLPRLYEDVCREWFLPTPLGYHASYPGE